MNYYCANCEYADQLIKLLCLMKNLKGGWGSEICDKRKPDIFRR